MIVLRWLEWLPLPTLTHREVELPALSGKIDAVIGMRLYSCFASSNTTY